MACLTSNQLCNVACISYNAGLRCCCLGCCIETNGGNIIGKEGGSVLIVSPFSTQVCSRSWCCRTDAVTTANTLFASNWFIPSPKDLKFALEQKLLGYWPDGAGNNGVFWSDERNQCANTNNAWVAHTCCIDENHGIGHFTTSHFMKSRAFRRVYY